MANKIDEENVALMRRLLCLERSDALTFEDKDGNPVIPDYDGLKDRSRSRQEGQDHGVH